MPNGVHRELISTRQADYSGVGSIMNSAATMEGRGLSSGWPRRPLEGDHDECQPDLKRAMEQGQAHRPEIAAQAQGHLGHEGQA